MAEGTVRWFNSERGYGVIVPDGGAGEVRVHYSQIQRNGYKTLEPGERVSFDVAYGPNGVRAVTVTPLGEIRTPPAAPSPGSAAGSAARPGAGAGTSRSPGAGGPERIGGVRGILIGLLALLMLGCAVAFVVVAWVQGEETGAVFLLLALAFGGLLALLERR